MSKTLGMPLGDVILYYAAQGAGLPVPDYVETAVEASRNDLQEALVA
jgi:membrane protein DedA with SNARE-associated domain